MSKKEVIVGNKYAWEFCETNGEHRGAHVIIKNGENLMINPEDGGDSKPVVFGPSDAGKIDRFLTDVGIPLGEVAVNENGISFFDKGALSFSNYYDKIRLGFNVVLFNRMPIPKLNDDKNNEESLYVLATPTYDIGGSNSFQIYFEQSSFYDDFEEGRRGNMYNCLFVAKSEEDALTLNNIINEHNALLGYNRDFVFVPIKIDRSILKYLSEHRDYLKDMFVFERAIPSDDESSKTYSNLIDTWRNFLNKGGK